MKQVFTKEFLLFVMATPKYCTKYREKYLKQFNTQCDEKLLPHSLWNVIYEYVASDENVFLWQIDSQNRIELLGTFVHGEGIVECGSPPWLTSLVKNSFVPSQHCVQRYGISFIIEREWLRTVDHYYQTSLASLYIGVRTKL